MTNPQLQILADEVLIRVEQDIKILVNASRSGTHPDQDLRAERLTEFVASVRALRNRSSALVTLTGMTRDPGVQAARRDLVELLPD